MQPFYCIHFASYLGETTNGIIQTKNKPIQSNKGDPVFVTTSNPYICRMPQYPNKVKSKLPNVGTTIFTIMSGLANETGAPQPTDKLTARERDVLKLLVDGHSNREIAGRLFVSPNTVRSHLQSISTKLGISSRAKLAAYGRSVPIRD